MIILVSNTYAEDKIEPQETTIWNEFSDFFLNIVGVEPALQLQSNDFKTQDYKLKKDVEIKTFDYEIKTISKEANLKNIKFEVFEQKECERLIIDEYESNITHFYNNNTKTEKYDCSAKIILTKQEINNKLQEGSDFLSVKVIPEFGETPKELCDPYRKEGQLMIGKCDEQIIDFIPIYNGRKYTEYAQFLMSGSAWNGQLSNLEENATGVLTLTTYASGSSTFDNYTNTPNEEWGADGNPTPRICANVTNYGSGIVSSIGVMLSYNNPTLENVTLEVWITDAAGNVEPGTLNNLATCTAINITSGADTWYYCSAEQFNATIDLNGITPAICVYGNGGGSNTWNWKGIAPAGAVGEARWTVSDTWEMNAGLIYELNISSTSTNTEGNFTSVGFGNETSSNWDTLNYLGFNNVEFCYGSSDDNITFTNCANVTNGADIGVNNIKYGQVRGQCINSVCFGTYINITQTTLQTPTNPTNLKINATTDSNLTTNDVYAEFITGTSPDNFAIVYNLSWYNDAGLNLTFGNLTNKTALTLEVLESENLTKGHNWSFSVIDCDIPNYACGSEIYSTNITILSQPPTTPTMNYPANLAKSGNTTIELNCSGSTDPDGDTIYYEFYVNGANPPTTLVQSSTSETYTYSTEGDSWFRCRATDLLSYSPYTDPIFFQMDSAVMKNATLGYENTVYETGIYEYNASVTINYLNVNDISATITYNNTEYTATKELISNQTDIAEFKFSKNIQNEILGDVTQDGFWNFTISLSNGTTDYNTSYTFSNTLSRIQFDVCNETLTEEFINLTFKDESNGSYIPASIRDSSFVYSLDQDKALTKSITFVNDSNEFNFIFCSEPINKTYYVTADVDYWVDGVYPQRTFNQPLSLTNSVFEQILWLVKASDGLYVTFQVINAATQPIADVFVNITRSDHTVVENGYTGNDGAITFWLNPDLTYTADFIKSGYDSYSTTQKFTQSTYTITMGSETTVQENNYLQGVKYNIYPKEDMLNNDTTYNFNVTFSSTYWTMQSAGFTITNQTGIVLGSTSCTGDTGCIASTNVNVLNEQFIIMNYYWVIEGNYSNGTRVWSIATTSEWGQSSVGNLVSDVRRLGSGFNDFSKAMISMFFILMIIGVSSYVSGTVSPLAVLIETFALVSFFDYIGFLSSPVTAVPHFIPIMVGLILFSYIVWEFTSK